MDRATINGFDKKLRFTITHGVTQDLQFTLSCPADFRYEQEDNKYEYIAESNENTKKTISWGESVTITYEPKQLTSTQMGYIDSMYNYSRLNGYVIKMKPDTVNSYEPTVIISDVKYDYEANQHKLARVTIKLKMKYITKISSFSVV